MHRFGFRETPDAAGLFLLTKAGQDTRPAHRLRLRSGAVTYLTTVNDTERRRLADPADPNRRFDDEGVLGHVYTSPRPGTVALYRYSRNSDWRLGKDTRQDLIRAGYANDGLVGYVPAR